MKLKGINPFEQHADKIVLAVVVFLLMGAVAAQFVLSPNAVDDTAPGDLDDEVKRRASALLARIQDDADVPAFERPELMPLVKAAIGRERRIADAGSMGVGFTPAVDAGSIGPVGLPPDPVVLPRPGASDAIASWVTVDPYFATQSGELLPWLTRFGVGQPFDTPVVTVQASFDTAELRRTLEQPSSGGPIPLRVIALGMEILAVEVERQRRMESGGWDEPEVVPQELWVPSLLGGGSGDLSTLHGAEASEVLALSRRALENRTAIVAPPPMRTISGDPLVLPGRKADREAWAGKVARRADLERRIATLDRQIERRTAGGAEAPRNLVEDRDEARAELEALVVEIEAFLSEAQSMPPGNESGALYSLGETIPLIAHDATATPGSVYRYRLRVVTNNPLFQQQNLAGDNPATLDATEDATVGSPWSEWSEPVEVLRRNYFFVRTATLPNNALNISSKATVDLYAMYYGHYRHATVTIEPGDPVRGELELSKADQMFLFDPERRVDSAAFGAFLEAIEAGQSPDLPAGLTRVDGRRGLGSSTVLVGVSPSMAIDAPPSAVFFDPLEGRLLTRSPGDTPEALRDRIERSAAVGEVLLPDAPQGVEVATTRRGSDPIDPGRTRRRDP